MCDYSLENVASRPAVVSDRLITTSFPTSATRGFAAVGDVNTAVCLRPGTELVFDKPPKHGGVLIFWVKTATGKVARFRKVNVANPLAHHDALEFADGTMLLVANLRRNQRATVLQLPPSQEGGAKNSEEAQKSAALTSEPI
jgi:hypothetical protein